MAEGRLFRDEGRFTTMHLSNQDFAEVDPDFIRHRFNDIPTIWKLIIDGQTHEIKFNGSCIFPLMTEGWRQLMDICHVPNLRKVRLIYVGYGYFHMTVLPSPPIGTTIAAPHWHSMNPARRQIAFTVVVSWTHSSRKYLELTTEFALFLRRSHRNWFALMLRNSAGELYCCDIIFGRLGRTKTKLGHNWFKFRRSNNLRQGQLITFVFLDPDRSAAIVHTNG